MWLRNTLKVFNVALIPLYESFRKYDALILRLVTSCMTFANLSRNYNYFIFESRVIVNKSNHMKSALRLYIYKFHIHRMFKTPGENFGKVFGPSESDLIWTNLGNIFNLVRCELFRNQSELLRPQAHSD